jgi:signal transduction histidine kinase
MADGAARRILQSLAARSIITAPLRVHERHVGVISFVLSVSGRTYAENDVPFAEEVALRAAAAIENARLYQQTQSLNAELEARVAARTREWRQASEELRELAGHLQSTREEERASIARELHDELGQLLTVIKIEVSQLAKRLANNLQGQNGSLPITVAQLQAIQQMLDEGVRSIRALVANLRPQILDDLGLRAALEWQVQQFQERTGIETQFTTNVERLSWDREREMALFRILQESLNNVARHAGATRVAVGLQQDLDALTLEVRDNGHGISHEAMLKENHFGILGMRERAILLGGGISIDGAPGKGTQVVVRVPQS